MDMENVVQAVGEIVYHTRSLSRDRGVARVALLDGRLFRLSFPIMVGVVFGQPVKQYGYQGISIDIFNVDLLPRSLYVSR